MSMGSAGYAFSAQVFGPRNNPVHTECEHSPDGALRINFRPVQAGTHTIKIYEGNDRDAVSEFVHDIEQENVGADASFTINLEEPKRSIWAIVTSPSNQQIECKVDQSDNDNCMVRFLPKELGDHIVRIFQDDSGVPVSEFVYHVTDLNQEVGTSSSNERRNSLRVGEKARINIDLNGAMTEEPQPQYRATIFNQFNQEIDCEFEELGDDRCKVRFVPNTLGAHLIKVFKIGSNKAIYEFTFDSEEKNIGQITTFTITVQEYKPKLTAKIKSPSGQMLDCSVDESTNENWRVQFVPRESGDHVIRIYQDDQLESPITEFIYRVVKRDAMIPPGRDVFRVGELVRMIYNIEGRQVKPETAFSATVTSPSNKVIKSIFEELDDGTCKVRFVPTELGKYVIKLFKTGKDTPISEFTFDAKGEHQEETASFTITIQAKKAKFSALVISPTHKQVECTVDETTEGHCLLRFTPTEIGNYVIQIFETGEKLPVSTIIYKIVERRYDLSRKLPSDNIFHVGEPIRVIVDVAEAKLKFSATVTSPSNAQIDCHVEESDEGNCVVKFVPNEPGDYIIRIFQGNNPIPISQFTYKVKKQSVSSSRPSLGEANFCVNVSESVARKYSATVTSPSGQDLHCRVEETEDGSCRVRFIPIELGDYMVRLFQNDMQICQFTYKVNDLVQGEQAANPISYGSDMKSNVDGKPVFIQDQIFKLGEKVSFYLNLEENSNKFSAVVTSPRHELLDCVVEQKNSDEFIIRFTPKELGDHVVKIYNGGKGNLVYQFIYKVRGFLGKPVEFKVTSFSPEPGRLAYKIMCPPKSKINYGEDKEGGKDGGLYEINVHLNDEKEKDVRSLGSGANKCTAQGPGLRRAQIGELATFEVNTRYAGRGSLMVGVEGPKQPAKEIVVKHTGEQVYSVNYVLDMEGNYSLYVLWGGEHIPGSPFHVAV